MYALCKGRKKCVALVMIGDNATLHQHIGTPVIQLKYSIQVAWVLAKRMKDGFAVRLQCGKKARSWMEYDKTETYASKGNGRYGNAKLY